MTFLINLILRNYAETHGGKSVWNTVADYDGSATDETGYVGDNRMQTFQSGLEYITF